MDGQLKGTMALSLYKSIPGKRMILCRGIHKSNQKDVQIEYGNTGK